MEKDKQKKESPKERKYINILLDLWEAIATYRTEVRKNYIQNQIDMDNLAYYISLLSSLWLELYPKMQDNKELKEKFEEYKPAYKDPTALLDNPEKVFELEEILREALEVLKVTEFEKVE